MDAIKTFIGEHRPWLVGAGFLMVLYLYQARPFDKAEDTEQPATQASPTKKAVSKPIVKQAPRGTHEVFDTYKDENNEPWLTLRTLPNPRTGQPTGRLEDGTTLVVKEYGLGHKGKWAKIEVTSGTHVNQTGYVNTKWIRRF
ncbi:MAG TPA: hypothetical protein EYN66_13120 [Myxococcales bacterium]|nr:hypothetical protein [Myxococcales bacterium]